MKPLFPLILLPLAFTACSSISHPSTTPPAEISKSVSPKFSFYTWHQGEPPKRLIKKEDGFCALTLVTGHFQGGGEVVRVYIGKDGYWYIGGTSMQEGVAGQCIVVRYAP